MPVVHDYGIKTRGRPLYIMAHIKKIIVDLKAMEKCLAHALIIGIANVDIDANYKAYHICRKVRPVVQTLLQETGIDLSSGGGITELNHLQEHFRD